MDKRFGLLGDKAQCDHPLDARDFAESNGKIVLACKFCGAFAIVFDPNYRPIGVRTEAGKA